MIYDSFKKEQAHSYIDKLLYAGHKVSITGVRKQRSLNQNAYFHSVICGVAGLDLGYTVQEMKEIFKKEFLSYEKNGLKFTKDTSSLTTLEFEKFNEQCRRKASEQGIFIPLPNEVTDQLINTLETSQKWLT
jgi:hypothetical protein